MRDLLRRPVDGLRLRGGLVVDPRAVPAAEKSAVTPRESSILNGLRRVTGSAKVQLAIGTLTTSYFAMRAAASDMPPTQRAAMWIAFQGAVLGCAYAVIAAWSAEDVADKAKPAPPTVQVAASDVINQATPTPQAGGAGLVTPPAVAGPASTEPWRWNAK